MSEEKRKAFWEAIQAETALKQKLQGITDSDGIVAIAKEADFGISADDLKKSQTDFSEEELEGVAGGYWDWANRVCNCSGVRFSEGVNWGT